MERISRQSILVRSGGTRRVKRTEATMDFELTVDQKLMKRNVRNFLNKEIAPLANEYERKYHSLPKEIVIKLLKLLAPFGYVGGILPEDGGGAGLSFLSYGLLLEELGQVYASLAFIELGQTIATRYAIYKFGSKELKAKFLQRMMSGEIICASAITEPDVGSAARDLTTTAVLQGDEYVINGTKTWATLGEIADIVYVTAVRDLDKGQRDFCTFVVEKGRSNFTARVLPKLGLRNAASAEIVFENCRVPKENILGEPGSGLEMTLEGVGLGRLAIATIALGIAEAALKSSVEYARQRKQFGRQIGRFQLIQEMIAEMTTEIECARLLTYKGWDILDKGTGSALAFSMAKLYSTEMAIRVTSKAIEIHGAYGLSEEYPLERYFRDARCLTFPDATSEIQKLIMGREILELKAFV
jgi:alkylation response protein AidB-like acyl-CoA dehydrogenase